MKVVLCDRCTKKLMYKRTKDKEALWVAGALKTMANKAVTGMDAVDTPLEGVSRSQRGTSREQRETSGSGGNEGRGLDHPRSDRHRDKRRRY